MSAGTAPDGAASPELPVRRAGGRARPGTGPFGRSLAKDVLRLRDRRRGLAEPAEVLDQHGPVFGRTQLKDERTQTCQIHLERLARNEPELRHQVDLLERVEEVVRDRYGRGASAPVLRARPRTNRVGHDVGRVLHEQLHRVRHDQGRDRVRQVLLQLDQSFLKLRIGRLGRQSLSVSRPSLTQRAGRR